MNSQLLGCSLALFVFVAASSMAHAGEPATSFDEILSRLDAATALPERIYIKQNELYTQRNIKADHSEVIRYISIHSFLKKDGDRYNAADAQSEVDAGGRFIRDDGKTRYVVTDDQQLLREEDPKIFGVSYLDRGETVAHAMWCLHSGLAMNGIVDGDGLGNRVSDVMRAGWNKTVMTESDGNNRTVFVLRADSRYGAHAIWVDPTNWLPTRIEVTQAHGSLVNNSPLPEDVVEKQTVCDNFHTAEINGRMFNDGVQVSIKTTHSDGRLDEITTVDHRIEIDTHPQFNGPNDFKMDMPEGTKVVFEPRIKGAEYEWRNGEPEPIIDKAPVAAVGQAMDDVQPASQPAPGLGSATPGKFYMELYTGIAIALATAVAIGIGMLTKRKKSP